MGPRWPVDYLDTWPLTLSLWFLWTTFWTTVTLSVIWDVMTLIWIHSNENIRYYLEHFDKTVVDSMRSSCNHSLIIFSVFVFCYCMHIKEFLNIYCLEWNNSFIYKHKISQNLLQDTTFFHRLLMMKFGEPSLTFELCYFAVFYTLQTTTTSFRVFQYYWMLVLAGHIKLI